MGARHTLKVSPETQDVINSCIADGLVLKLPPRQLDRKLYLDVKKVVEAAGGKWDTKVGGFIFSSVGDLEKCVNAGKCEEIVRTKVVQQAFYTPPDVAEMVIDFAGVGVSGCSFILEPSCGAGALITAALNRDPLAKVVGYDNDANAVEACIAKFKTNKNVTIVQQDFLTVKPARYDFARYDFILANPPFQNGQVAVHLSWMVKFMGKGSRLCCVVPGNFDPIGLTGYDISMKKLPAGAFKSSGTMVATSILRMTK